MSSQETSKVLDQVRKSSEKVAETVLQKLHEANVVPGGPAPASALMCPWEGESSSSAAVAYSHSEISARIVGAIAKAENCCKAAGRMSRQAALAFDEEAHHLAEARELYSKLAGAKR